MVPAPTSHFRVLRTSLAGLTLAVLLACGCSDPGQRGPIDSSTSDTAPDATVDGNTGDVADTSPDADTADTADDAADPQAPEYPLTNAPYTTLQRLWAPLNATSRAEEAMDNGDLEVTDIDKYKKYGLGVEPLSGQPWVEHDELPPGYAGPVAGQRRSLLYFWQSTDPQLIDEESPIRFAGTTVAPAGSTYRPQGHLTTQVYESMVRTARRISEKSGRPFDFAFVSGDFTDGGQKNEVQWAVDILKGGLVHPDSGVDNDPVPGPKNDFTDPFWSRGIGVPWYLALGNHETLYTGVFEAIDLVKEAAVGDEVFAITTDIPGVDSIEGLTNGYRDASTPTGEVVTEGKLPPDEDRQILALPDLLEHIHSAGGRPAGHGLTAKKARKGVGYYSFRPLPDKPIRFIVLNTLSHDPAHASGAVDEQQFEWLKTQLAEAKEAGELVLVGGHHRTEDFTVVSEIGGGDIKDLLASYENVILYLVGHAHHNGMRKVDPDDKRGYWELMCASTVDYPMQTRILELVYDGNGYLSVYATNIEQNAPRGTPGHFGRELAAGRKVFLPIKNDVRKKWRGQLEATNVLLRYKLPEAVTENIESQTWPTRIESTETLQAFPEP
ncbi:MAG: hypothetical protein ABEN55_01185 [Bradymonadaceae bacterium]